jgi:hypothetical protein
LFVKTVEYVVTNFYIIISLLKKAFKQGKMITKVQKIEAFLSKSQCLKIFTLKGGFFKLMNKNNTLIELNVGKIARKINKANKIKLEKVIKEVLIREFAPALLYIFEIF